MLRNLRLDWRTPSQNNSFCSCRAAGLSCGDHTRKLCAAILRLVLGSEPAERSRDACSQFGRTKLFLKDGQVGGVCVCVCGVYVCARLLNLVTAVVEFLLRTHTRTFVFERRSECSEREQHRRLDC